MRFCKISGTGRLRLGRALALGLIVSVLAALPAVSQASDGQVIRVPSLQAPTIELALQQANPGDAIEVDARFYSTDGDESKFLPDGEVPTGLDEPLPITVDRTEDVTLRSVNGRAVIDGNPDKAVISVSADHTVIEGFEITGGASGVRVESAANVSVRDNVITDHARSGVLFDAAENGAAVDNLVESTGQGIVFLNGSDEETIAENTVRDVVERGIWLKNARAGLVKANDVQFAARFGIVVERADDNEIVENRVVETTEPVTQWGGSGILIVSDSEGNTVAENESLRNERVGILLLDRADENVVTGNKVFENEKGIVVNNSNANGIAENEISQNSEHGMGIWNTSQENEVRGNAVDANGWGIALGDGANENIIAENTVSDNDRNGVNVSESQSNRILDNEIFGNRVHGMGIWNDAQDNEVRGNSVDANGKGIAIASGADNNRLVENTISNTQDYRALSLHQVSETLVKDNVLEKNVKFGITVDEANNNKIIGNEITETRQDNPSVGNNDGIRLDDAEGNLISDNQVVSNATGGIGIVNGSLNNRVTNNVVMENGGAGIGIGRSLLNEVSENTVAENGGPGIELGGSNGNEITDNTLSGNARTVEAPFWRISEITLAESSQNTVSGNRIGADVSAEVSHRDGQAPSVANLHGRDGSSARLPMIPFTQDPISPAPPPQRDNAGVEVCGGGDNTVINNDIQNVRAGISTNATTSNSFRGNSVQDSDVGIRINPGSRGNWFTDNAVRGNRVGARATDAGDNVLRSNAIAGNEVGVALSNSTNLTYKDNTFENNDADVQTDFIPDELLVRFREDVAESRIQAIVQDQGTGIVQSFPLFNIYHLQLQTDRDVREVIDAFQALPEVVFAEVNGRWRVQQASESQAFTPPDDAAFAMQWSLRNRGQAHPVGSGGESEGQSGADIGIVDAWEAGLTDSSGVAVALLDSGVDLAHPDLMENLRLDGAQDVVRGDTEPEDEIGHGTFIAGVIGARPDNEAGIAGISWTASILPIKVVRPPAEGLGAVVEGLKTVVELITGATWSDALVGLEQVVRLKAEGENVRIVNFSIGGANASRSLRVAMETLNTKGILVVTSAGNSGRSRTVYPCGYGLPNVICVAATTDHDELAEFSNFEADASAMTGPSASGIDLAAPGQDVIGLKRMEAEGGFVQDTGYSRAVMDQAAVSNGTSFAAAHVTGVAALLMSTCPEMGHTAIKELILDNVEPVESLADKVASGGRLQWPETLPETCGQQ